MTRHDFDANDPIERAAVERASGRLRLEPVTRRTFAAVVATTAAPGQERFVTPNLYSIAEAYVEPTWTPLAILVGDEVVGFAMYGHDAPSGQWWIIRFMIGATHQRRGFGAEGLAALVRLLTKQHGCREVFLSYVPGNAVAERLYARAGFAPTGEIEDGEIVARLDLRDQAGNPKAD
jgi:diamine N-acetyltransferase